MPRIRISALASTLIAASLAIVGPGGAAGAATARTPQFSAQTQRTLNDIVVSGMGAASLPGLVVGVWVPGRGSFVRALGTSNLATGAPIGLNDHFRIASITKSFVATTVLRLVDQRRLSLNDKLSRYVRGIPNGDRITIAHLLNMTSGIYDYVADPALLRTYNSNPLLPFNLRRLVAIVRRNKPLFAPGAAAVYDNSNYYLLGVIAERAAGKPLPTLIKTEILDRLGMTHTSFPTTSALPSPFSHGYLAQPNFPPRDVTGSNPAFAGGAGAMISTLADLRIWASALATGSLLSPGLRAMQQRTRVLSRSPKVTLRYGMGLTDVNGLLGHDGAINGYGSAMFYLPSAKATIVLLANKNDANAPAPLIPAVALAAYLFPKQFPRGI
jgi:D-alanyl-D-alanine carboxypeptidase